jgi:hypothetical protein
MRIDINFIFCFRKGRMIRAPFPCLLPAVKSCTPGDSGRRGSVIPAGSTGAVTAAGTLVQAILVDADSYLAELLRYIHLNPVRAGMVKSPEEYPWSGHRGYLIRNM